LTPVAPSCALRWQPYLGSKIHGPGTEVDFGRNFKPALAAIVPSVSNPWLRNLSLLRWHKSTIKVTPKPTPVAQDHFGRNLKPAPVAKLFIFSKFSFTLAFRKVLFVFCIISPPVWHKVNIGFQVASKVHSADI
jgi:hypothetical protein